MDPIQDDATDETWFDAWRGVLFASGRVLAIADRDMLEHEGFPLTWFDVLAQLGDAPAGLRMQELEEVSLFTRGGMTRLVDRIEAAGLVRREAVPGDRRGVRVVRTQEGARRFDAAMARHRVIIEREFARRLGRDQRQAVSAALWSWWHTPDAEAAAPDAPQPQPE
jgi:DNA-binding MarR family transcriptional regulator